MHRIEQAWESEGNSNKGEDGHNPRIREGSQGVDGYSNRWSSSDATYNAEMNLWFFKMKNSGETQVTNVKWHFIL